LFGASTQHGTDVVPFRTPHPPSQAIIQLWKALKELFVGASPEAEVAVVFVKKLKDVVTYNRSKGRLKRKKEGDASPAKKAGRPKGKRFTYADLIEDPSAAPEDPAV